MAKLDTIVLTATVTKIGSYAFNGCSALKGIRLHEGITSVGHPTSRQVRLKYLSTPPIRHRN